MMTPGRVILHLTAVLALWGAVGCSPDPPPRVVILLSIDTLRADHLGAYGYRRPTSPNLDALAREGTVFEDAAAPSPWTLPAHGSLLTGLYPSRHGLKSHQVSLPENVRTLASVLSQEGYLTAAVVNSHNLSRLYGLDRGFQEFHYVKEQVRQIKPSHPVTERAMKYLETVRDRPLFLFLHYYDVHSDYRSLPVYESRFQRPYDGLADGSTAQLIAYREGKVSLDRRDAAHLIDLYDAGIRQLDNELGRLFSFMRESGIWEECLLIVTSDHGEEFLEHGGVLHGRTQFREVLQVPLVIRGPGIPDSGRLGTPVSLVDVVPTLLALLKIPAPPSLDGIDLAPLWQSGNQAFEDRYLFGEADHRNVRHDITRSVRQGAFKLHYNRLTRATQLYHLQNDPGEQVNIMEERPRIGARLLARLHQFMQTEVEGMPGRRLTPAETNKLKSLGYLQ